MGGALAIAIRRTNGTEYISERWTNPLPHWLSNPAFWDDGVVVDEYIKKGLENYTPVDRVFPSEYGTVVIDFQTKRVFSRQDYCGVHPMAHVRLFMLRVLRVHGSLATR